VLKALFVAIILVFMFWGVGTVGTNQVEMAARVNDEVISQRQFERIYQRVAAAYQNMGPQAPPVDFLRSQALNQLIDVELLNQEANRLGLAVDADELRAAISSSPDFQRDGRFDRDAYLQLLQQNGYKPSDFEEMQRRRMVAGKVQELVRSGVHVSDQEVQDRFRFENERLNLRFVRIPATDFINQVTISDEDIAAYFNDHQENYREPDRVRVKLVDFRPEDFAGQVTPSEAEIQAYYETNKETYRRPEEVQARHILLKAASDAPAEEKAAARKQADEILSKAKGGADFAELAKQYSQDGTAESGGDLGKFGRGVMTPTFETAAFALEPGQISDVVETPFGFHIIKVEAKVAEHMQSVDEARAAITEAIKTQQARQVALQKVEAAHEQLLDGKTIDDVAAEAGLTVQAPPPFSRTENVGTLGPRPELAKQAFVTEAGEIGDIVTEPPGYTIFVVEQNLPSAIPELGAVRNKVEQDLRFERASEAAKKRAEELLATLKQQPDLNALAGQENLKIEESTQIGRSGPYIPNIGSSQDLKDAAFRLTPAAPVAPAAYMVGTDAVLVVLGERIAADDSRFAAEKKTLQDRLQQRAEAAAVQRFIDQLKVQAQIEYGPAFRGLNAAS
jgi:peptidyl-prolyl cis-trans isomerase D